MTLEQEFETNEMQKTNPDDPLTFDHPIFIKNKKDPNSISLSSKSTNSEPPSFQTRAVGGGANQEFADELPTILGAQLNNPYTTNIMAQAYSVVTGNNVLATDVPVTHYYIKYTPANLDEVAFLEDEAEIDVNLQPLDYELIQEGDYYIQPGKTIEDIPDIYTVVKADSAFPTNVSHIILANLHIPQNDLVEELALNIAEGATYGYVYANGLRQIERTDINVGSNYTIARCFAPDPDDPFGPVRACDDPPPGGGGTPPINVNSCGPALVMQQAKKARGRIRFKDTQLATCQPLQNVKIVGRFWFKRFIDYTDADGMFQSENTFHKKVNINVYFVNRLTTIRPFRTNFGITLSIFNFRARLGKFNIYDMNRIDKVFEKDADRTSRKFMEWIACHALQSRNDQKKEAEIDGLKVMYDSDHWRRTRLNTYLVPRGDDIARRPEAELVLQRYIYKTKGFGDWIFDVQKLGAYIIKKDVVGAVTTLVSNVISAQKPDILFKYNTYEENLSSNEINQQFYRAYSTAGLFKAVDVTQGVAWKGFFKVKDKLLNFATGLTSPIYKLIKYYDPQNPTNPTSSATMFNMVSTMFQVMYITNYTPDVEFYQQAEGFG